MKRLIKLLMLCSFIGVIIFMKHFDETNMDRSIDNGLKFLKNSQLPYGEFMMEACYYKNQSLDNLYYEKDCIVDSTTGNTALVGLALKNFPKKDIGQIINKSSYFLLGEQQEGGTWNYFTNDSIFSGSIPPDTDDTAVVSRFLKINDISFENNTKVFEENLENGLVQTWIVNKSNGFYGEYGCNVNVNILTYLSLINKQDLIDCDKLKQIIFSSNYECCIYCENGLNEKVPFFLFYNIAKSLNYNSCFEDSKEIIIEELLSLQNEDGSFGFDIYTAFAITSLIELDYPIDDINLKKSIMHLLSTQNKDGSWDSDFYLSEFKVGLDQSITERGKGLDRFWTWGSTELSTALALESLNSFKRKKIQNGQTNLGTN